MLILFCISLYIKIWQQDLEEEDYSDKEAEDYWMSENPSGGIITAGMEVSGTEMNAGTMTAGT